MSNFKLFHHNDCDFDALCLPSGKLTEGLEEMKSRRIKVALLNSQNGWNDGSLDFLTDNRWIEGLIVLADNVDVTILNSLPNIKRLSLNGRSVRGKLDFGNLPELIFFEGSWDSSRFTNFDKCTQCQFVWLSKWPWKDLLPLSGFAQLETLKLDYGKLETLNGIGILKSLRRLNLYSFPHLFSLDDIKNANQLQSLLIEKCRSITDYNSLKNLTQLKGLVLSECPPIDTISFIRNCNDLHYAYIGLEILDKDVSILKEKEIEFKRSKHYK